MCMFAIRFFPFEYAHFSRCHFAFAFGLSYNLSIFNDEKQSTWILCILRWLSEYMCVSVRDRLSHCIMFFNRFSYFLHNKMFWFNVTMMPCSRIHRQFLPLFPMSTSLPIPISIFHVKKTMDEYDIQKFKCGSQIWNESATFFLRSIFEHTIKMCGEDDIEEKNSNQIRNVLIVFQCFSTRLFFRPEWFSHCQMAATESFSIFFFHPLEESRNQFDNRLREGKNCHSKMRDDYWDRENKIKAQTHKTTHAWLTRT